MTTIFPVAALVVTLVADSSAQAGITGKWQGETSNGSAIVLDVTAKGTELNGTMTRNSEKVPIGDQMKIWLDRQGAEKAIVLKRVKS